MDRDEKPLVTPKTPQEVSAQEFIEEVEARLKKEEKHSWMIKDHEHLHQNQE